MYLRIHHFYDIIRDFGTGNPILPHSFGHSYHNIAREIWEDSLIPVQLVISCDDVCKGCNKIDNGNCLDIISHRNDYPGKQAFNDHIDKKIMFYCDLKQTETYTPQELCRIAGKYADNMNLIYEGNDAKHTFMRNENFIKGLGLYSIKHRFDLNF